MKIKKPLPFILKPLIFGLAAAGIGIGLIFYYRGRDNASAASFVLAGLVTAAGAAGLTFGILNSFKIRRQTAILARGTDATAEFVRYDTKMSTSRSAIYYAEYKYEDAAGVRLAQTPGEFTWEEILALKSAGQFAIRHYRGRAVLTEDLEALKYKHAEEMRRLQAVYEKAYADVDALKKTPAEGLPERPRNSYGEKTRKKAHEEEERPSAKDD